MRRSGDPHQERELSELLAKIRRDKRNRRDRARRRFKKWVREVEQRALERISTVHVRPCINCRSTQLCEPECSLAPWNIKEED